MRAKLIAILSLTLLGTACGGGGQMVPVPGTDDGLKSSAEARAERRLYDGAPPVIGHEDFNIACLECHNEAGVEVPDVGFAPPMPHEMTAGMSATSRCRQCHVFRVTDDLFVQSSFEGLPQDLRRGDRLHYKAPPTIPHKILMRENCLACHSGPAAREEIRTTHPERTRCRQCHVAVTTVATFGREGAQP